MLKLPIVPIDPRTGKPREGKWVNRQWVPRHAVPVSTMPISNPIFDPDSVSFWGRGKQQSK